MIVKVCNADFSLQWDGIYQFALENYPNTQLFSKSNLVHCLLTVDFKTLFSSPRITS